MRIPEPQVLKRLGQHKHVQNPCFNAAIVYAVLTVAQCVVDRDPRVVLEGIEVLVGAVQLPHTDLLSGDNPDNIYWEKLDAGQIRIPYDFAVRETKFKFLGVRPEYNIAILRLNKAISDKVVTTSTKGQTPAVTFAPLGDTQLHQGCC